MASFPELSLVTAARIWIFICPERCILVFWRLLRGTFLFSLHTLSLKVVKTPQPEKLYGVYLKQWWTDSSSWYCSAFFYLQNGLSLCCLFESNSYFKNQIFVFLILCSLWWRIAVGHPIRMELTPKQLHYKVEAKYYFSYVYLLENIYGSILFSSVGCFWGRLEFSLLG